MSARRLLWVSVTLAAVVSGLFWWQSARVRNGIHVVSDVHPLTCEGSTVDVYDAGIAGGEQFLIPTATLEPDMRCSMRFFIENDSGSRVVIESISVPTIGPSGGSGMVATQLSPIRSEIEGPIEGEVDAVWRLDDQILDGEVFAFDVTVVFRPSGCTSQDGVIYFDWPNVTLRSWLMTIALTPETIPVGFVGTEHSSCDT